MIYCVLALLIHSLTHCIKVQYQGICYASYGISVYQPCDLHLYSPPSCAIILVSLYHILH